MSDTPVYLETGDASCRLYREAPCWDGQRTAAIGEFRCADPAAGAALLSHAGEVLGREGFEALIGPMDGDTWHRYRLVTDSDGSPPFLLEPVSAPHDEQAFLASGFAPISTYVSTRARLDEALAIKPTRFDGIAVRAWDGDDAERLLGDLFEMSLSSFATNPFYKAISREAFLALYRPILPAIDPRLLLFAHDADGLAGFLFGVPDLAEGANPRTVIVKTYASRRRGVGRQLLDTFHHSASDLGFTSVIHALMHENNQSLNSSRRYGAEVFRRYALMGRRLAA
ncbi:hypothetical protein IEI94_11815 [Halomonas sp. ML-15]|uniref:GNAT family N-acetyltransferase n=1 Tax=Halomonas sp. ML-15 TaxID=2773305 RepID=UPI001747670E|nr:GNAT family N-acetyltransferase [Halomonas sp. ML-15]MBD3896536.1 hypothetical protein [Halomonas sp. ML-15]